MSKDYRVAFFILLLFLFYYFFFQKENRENKIIERHTDTIKVVDTIIITKTKFIKVEAKPIPDTIKKEVEKIIKLKKDSLQKLIEYIAGPVDTTIIMDQSISKINYIPLKRELNYSLQFPKISEKIIVKDSIIIEGEGDYINYVIATGAGFILGILLIFFK